MIFFGHGNPMYAIGDNAYTREWGEIGQRIGKPDAVVSVSAHWETDGTRVTSNVRQRTIHDFYGFPQELFDVSYDVPGEPDLAREIIGKLGSDRIVPDDSWGLDHGSWSVLRHLFPAADVPVIQISLDRAKSVNQHFQLASELRFLREKRILFIGSGNIVHNLRLADFRRSDGDDWAIRANDRIRKAVEERDLESLVNYAGLGSDVRLAVPTPEHFLPLIYVLGMSRNGDRIRTFNDNVEMASLAMTSFEITT